MRASTDGGPAGAPPPGRAAEAGDPADDGRSPVGSEPKSPLPGAAWRPGAGLNTAPGVGATDGRGHGRGGVDGPAGATFGRAGRPSPPAPNWALGRDTGACALEVPLPTGGADHGGLPAMPPRPAGTPPGFESVRLWEKTGKDSSGSGPGKSGSPTSGAQQATARSAPANLFTDACQAAKTFFLNSGGYARRSADAVSEAWQWPHSGRHRSPTNLPRTPPGGLSKRQTWADLPSPTAQALTLTESAPSCLRARL